jgi:hypothetical protein
MPLEEEEEEEDEEEEEAFGHEQVIGFYVRVQFCTLTYLFMDFAYRSTPPHDSYMN